MGNHFVLLRNLTIAFASVMLVKYYLFLMMAPFYGVKQEWRRRRLIKTKTGRRTRPLVSVVVPAWNEEVGLIKTVQSLLDNSYPLIEVVVVNDGSTDRSDQLMRRYLVKQSSRSDAKSLRYFYKENGGKGSALNYGIMRAKGEIIVTMDADSVMHPQAIERIANHFQDPKLDALVGNVKVVGRRDLLGLLQTLEYRFGFYFKRAHCVLGAEYIYGGACAAFRKSSTFQSIGLFDTQNKTEDIEMSMRTKFYGLKSIYAEDVICYTEGASSLGGLLSQRLRWKKGRLDTFLKYRQLFFSRKRRHNKWLAWFVLPYSLLSELQLFFEPLGLALLTTYSIITGDYVSIALGILFIFLTYLVTAIFNQQKLDLKLLAVFILTWPLFYLLVWVEYLALLKSLGMAVRGDEIVWQRWERQGVELAGSEATS